METIAPNEIQVLKDKIKALEKTCLFYYAIINQVPSHLYITNSEERETWLNRINVDMLPYTIEDIKHTDYEDYLKKAIPFTGHYNNTDKLNHENQKIRSTANIEKNVCFNCLTIVNNVELDDKKLTLLNDDDKLANQVQNQPPIEMILTDNLKFDNNLLLNILTKREIEVINWVCKGLSSKRIAQELHLSLYTIETHRKNVYRKLKLRDIPSLVLYCKEMGLV
jgi:DNA-binding CsgD family transcriptional regulator